MKDKPLRKGFTTGTCAAVAAKAAAAMLLTGVVPDTESVMTPGGIQARLIILEASATEKEAVCAVKKDAGDDPDVTNGVLVYARISYIEHAPSGCYESSKLKGLWLGGGMGIGLVTRPGLSCPIGYPAINPVPRRMILEQVELLFEDMNGRLPALIQIEIPKGAELAEKTFNPKLGVTGGISILGTSGIVEPMSEKALLDTIHLEIGQKAAEGKRHIIMVPGNYGMNFLGERLGIPVSSAVKTSNFIGDAVRMASEIGIERILLAGHLGKLIKVAGGMKNTHSKYGDNRMETLAGLTKAALKEQGLEDERLVKGVLGANTTEEALGYLQERELCSRVMELAALQAGRRLKSWYKGKIQIEVVTFSSVYDILGMTNEKEIQEIIDEYCGT